LSVAHKIKFCRKKLAALMARLKELEAQIPGAELEANIKTRHLKNQYLK